MHFIGGEVYAVRPRGVEHQFGKRQVEQHRDLVARSNRDGVDVVRHGALYARAGAAWLVNGPRYFGGGKIAGALWASTSGKLRKEARLLLEGK